MKRLRSILERLGSEPAIAEQIGATTLEYTLLLAAIAVPSYWISRAAMDALVGHYQLMTTLNGLPFP